MDSVCTYCICKEISNNNVYNITLCEQCEIKMKYNEGNIEINDTSDSDNENKINNINNYDDFDSIITETSETISNSSNDSNDLNDNENNNKKNNFYLCALKYCSIIIIGISIIVYYILN